MLLKERGGGLMNGTAVVIHGYGLTNRDWNQVVWGNPRACIYGRASRGLMVAHELLEEVSFVYWGGGGSERDGKSEADITFEYAMQHAHELQAYDGLRDGEIYDLLGLDMFIDAAARNTREELINCAGECYISGVKRMVIVSSPHHASRCLRDALALRACGELGDVRDVVVIPSDVDPECEPVSDVAIVEPRHYLNKHVRRMLEIPHELASGFAQDLDLLLAKYLAEETKAA